MSGLRINHPLPSLPASAAAVVQKWVASPFSPCFSKEQLGEVKKVVEEAAEKKKAKRRLTSEAKKLKSAPR
jgi:hypothetical protein